ncbi:MAG: nucleoid occlusion factor SlmA [Cellvibrio sp.]
MASTNEKIPRRQHILECLATMLEESPGERITTAALARQVGVSEAALYRHFPSKSKMFEGLIEFIESSIFTRVNVILNEEPNSLARIEAIMTLLLAFMERNPGMTRLLTGDALTGETERLRTRILQFHDRIETQLKQILREAELRDGLAPRLPIGAAANLLVNVIDGKALSYVRSGFKRNPVEAWPEQWKSLSEQFLEAVN